MFIVLRLVLEDISLEMFLFFLPGAVSGPERAVDDGRHSRWTEGQQGSISLPAGTTEAPQ